MQLQTCKRIKTDKIILFQVRLGTEVLHTRSSIRSGFELMTSKSRPPDHDSTLHVTETLALTTRPSMTTLPAGGSINVRHGS